MHSRKKLSTGTKTSATNSEHNIDVDREDTSLDDNRRRRMRLRRASSFEEPRASSLVKLPPVRRKRYSLPASPIPRNSDEEIGYYFFKTASDITVPRGTEDTFKNTREQPRKEGKITAHVNKFDPSCTKSLDCEQAQNVIPRHLNATLDDNQRLPRRRITLHVHNLMTTTTGMCP